MRSGRFLLLRVLHSGVQGAGQLWQLWQLDSCDSWTVVTTVTAGQLWTHSPVASSRLRKASRRQCWAPRFQSPRKWGRWSKSRAPCSSETAVANLYEHSINSLCTNVNHYTPFCADLWDSHNWVIWIKFLKSNDVLILQPFRTTKIHCKKLREFVEVLH